MKKTVAKYRVIKGGTSYRWRAGDIWEVAMFTPEFGYQLVRNRTSYLNGSSLARQMVRSGHFQQIMEVTDE